MMSRPVADNCAPTGRFLFGGSMSTDLTTLVLPDGELVTEPPVLAEYRLNPYTQETAAEGQPIAVVFATSVADVQATLQFATAHHIPVVTQGARTSISNGAAGLDGSILLNLSRLNHIVALQPENQTAVVEAGC
jgi:FAD/FMN-containing dehydrogenases